MQARKQKQKKKKEKKNPLSKTLRSNFVLSYHPLTSMVFFLLPCPALSQKGLVASARGEW